MKADFSKKSKKTSRVIRNYWHVITIIAIILFGGISFFVDQHRKQPLFSNVIYSYCVKAKDWFVERKNHLNENIEKVKKVAGNGADPKPIHFEFYTALPNMQVKIASKEEMNEKPLSENKTLPVQKAVIKSSIFDANGLEEALKAELNQSHYVIQLGVFKTEKAADRYRLSMLKLGLKPEIIKTKLSQNFGFAVQLGSFESMAQAKLIKHQLQQKNIDGIIRLQE